MTSLGPTQSAVMEYCFLQSNTHFFQAKTTENSRLASTNLLASHCGACLTSVETKTNTCAMELFRPLFREMHAKSNGPLHLISIFILAPSKHNDSNV